MQQQYVVRLRNEERDTLREVVKQLKGTGQKVRRAQMLLKADANGPSWTDVSIADAFSCRPHTVEELRRRLVECGFDEALDGMRVPENMATFFRKFWPPWRGEANRPSVPPSAGVF